MWLADRTCEGGGRAALAIVPLARLDAEGPGERRLWGRFVRVRNAAVVNEPGVSPGEVVPVPVGDARPDERGDFLFEPQRGGARVDKYTLRSEKYRRRYVEAAHFGEVNAYFHLDLIGAYVDMLLRELGACSLPRVIAVVNAHHAATPRPDGTRDGVLRFERWVPFQGGHYRLPARRYGLAEHDPISRDGEIHLGPGWKLLEHGALVETGGGRYRHSASHNAGTIYHEYGHHITRHTADFRANALRAPERQGNGKTDLDEGFCDYWVAAMLEAPHIWAWHRRHDDQEIHGRSLDSPARMEEYDASDTADPHANGTIWAAALWELRTKLQELREDGARECDKLVLETLLLLGQEVGPLRPITARSVARARAGFGTALSVLLRADQMLHGGEHRDLVLECFARRGIHPDGSETTVPTPAVTASVAGDAGAARVPRRARILRLQDDGPGAQADLAAARVRLARHVPPEDVPETEDLYARGELGERLRALDEPPLSVVATGDTMLGGRTKPVIAEKGSEYVFKFVRPLLRRASIVLGNLEGPFASQARRRPRNFSYRVDPRLALALKRAGFHVMSLANNHLLDCGRRGVLETLAVLGRAGIAPLGAGVDERAAHAPVILQAGALRVGFLGYYWNRRTAARGTLPGSAMDPPEALAADIGRLREQVDRVVVTFHWGVPYVREPSPEERARARWAVDCGADAVIGHHTHVIQPFEIHRDRPIFYGVGNLAFGSANSKGEGLLIGLRFEEQRTRVFVYPLYVKNRDPRVAYQPKVLRGSGARHYLQRLAQLSGPHGDALTLDDFRGVLELPWSLRPVSGERESRSSA